MVKVYIGFSEPNTWMVGAALIKWWMRTPYCHIYLRVYSKYTEQWLVYHASHGMVHVRLWDWFAQGNRIEREFEIELPDSDLRAALRYAQRVLGQPYGYIGLAKLVLARLGLRMRGDGLASFHCSEFIARLFPQLAEQVQIDADMIEPVHLYRALERAS